MDQKSHSEYPFSNLLLVSVTLPHWACTWGTVAGPLAGAEPNTNDESKGRRKGICLRRLVSRILHNTQDQCYHLRNTQGVGRELLIEDHCRHVHCEGNPYLQKRAPPLLQPNLYQTSPSRELYLTESPSEARYAVEGSSSLGWLPTEIPWCTYCE